MSDVVLENTKKSSLLRAERSTHGRPSKRPRPAATSLPHPRKSSRSRTEPGVAAMLACEDDVDGHLVYRLGDGLYPVENHPKGRYKILRELGEGTFGKVVECWDRHLGVRVAVKVIRSVPKYRDAAKLEIDVLQHIFANDPHGCYHCVRLLEYFDYRNHICIVFERLGPSLYEQLRRNRFQPFTLDQVRDFAYQLLESVRFVHSLTMIHTDLKPENILLADPDAATTITGGPQLGTREHADAARDFANLNATTASSSNNLCLAQDQGYEIHVDNHGVCAFSSHSRHNDHAVSKCGASSAIKLIDFGSATFEARHHSAVISTRHYRAPEVILGLGWTYPCDLWSVGCILVELFTGQALFQTHENMEHLAMMHVVLGPIPDSMIRRADSGSQKYFTAAESCVARLDCQSSRCQAQRDVENVSKRSSGCVRWNAKSREAYGAEICEDAVGMSWNLHGGSVRHPGETNPKATRGNASRPIAAVRISDCPEDLAGIDRRILRSTSERRVDRVLNWPAGASSRASIKAVKGVKCLADIVQDAGGHSTFLDLVRRLLVFDPDRRCTSAEALQHPFFRESFSNCLSTVQHPLLESCFNEQVLPPLHGLAVIDRPPVISKACGEFCSGNVYDDADVEPVMFSSGDVRVPSICLGQLGQMQAPMPPFCPTANHDSLSARAEANSAGQALTMSQVPVACQSIMTPMSFGILFPSDGARIGESVTQSGYLPHYSSGSTAAMVSSDALSTTNFISSAVCGDEGLNLGRRWFPPFAQPKPSYSLHVSSDDNSHDEGNKNHLGDQLQPITEKQEQDVSKNLLHELAGYPMTLPQAKVVEDQVFGTDSHELDFKSSDDISNVLELKPRVACRKTNECRQDCIPLSVVDKAVSEANDSQQMRRGINRARVFPVNSEFSDVTAGTFGIVATSCEYQP